MPASLLPFRSPSRHAVEAPLWSTPDDNFKEYVCTDDACSDYGVPPGALFLVYEGHHWPGYVHVVRIGGEPFLGVVGTLPQGRIRFDSWHNGEMSGVYGRDEATVEGPMVIYARGPNLPVWEVKPPRHTKAVAAGNA